MSTIDDQCPHDGDPHTCPPCQRKKGIIRDERETSSRAFAARFPGWCALCRLPIHEGQQIVVVDGHAVHHGCEP